MNKEEYDKKWPMDKIPDSVRKAAVAWGDHLFIRDKVKLAQDMLDATEEYRNDYAEQESISFAEWIRENEYSPRDKSDNPAWVQAGSKIGWLQPGHSIIRTTAQLYYLYKQSVK